MKKPKKLSDSEATELCRQMGRNARVQVVEMAAEEGIDLSEAEFPTPRIITDTRPGGCLRPNAEGISIGRGTIRHGR